MTFEQFMASPLWLALAGAVVKRAAHPAPRVYAEGLDVRRVGAYGRDHAHQGDQRLFHAFFPLSSARATLTMFMWMGHFCRHRPQPTQPNVPSWLSG